MTMLLILVGLGTFKMVLKAHEAHPGGSLSKDSSYLICYLRIEKKSQHLHLSLLRVTSDHKHLSSPDVCLGLHLANRR